MSPDMAGADTSVPSPRPSELDTADAALLETLLREAPVGFALFGTDLCFRRINGALARMLDTGPDEHIGRSPAEVWPADLAAQAESAGRRGVCGGRRGVEAGGHRGGGP